MDERVTPVRTRRRRLGIAGYATLFALVISALTLALTLFSYGHDLAYLESFGLTPEMLGRSPLDFLMRSYRPVVRFVELSSELWRIDTFRMWVTFMFSTVQLQTVIVALCLMVPVGVYLAGLRGATLKLRIVGIVKALKAKAWVVSVVNFLAVRSRRWGYFGWLGVPVAFLGGMSSLYLATGVVVSLLVVMVASIPALGVDGGYADAKALVLEARTCNRRLARIAPCVRIMKDGKAPIVGRLIDIGGGRAYLFRLDPKMNGEPATDGNPIISIPIDRSTIEIVGVLMPAPNAQATR